MKRLLRSSIRHKLILLFCCVILPLTALLIYTAGYTYRVLQSQVVLSNQAMLQVWRGQVDNSFDEVNRYYYNLALNSLDFEMVMLQTPGTDHYTIAKNQVWTDFRRVINDFQFIDAMFLIKDSNMDVLVRSQADLPQSDISLQQQLAAIAPQLTGGWHVHRYDHDTLLIQVYQFMDVRVGFAASNRSLCDKIMKDTQLLSGTLTVGSAESQGERSDVWTFYEDSGHFPYRLILTLPEREVLQSLPTVWNAIRVLCVIIVFSIPLLAYLLKKMLLDPMKQINKALVHLEQGDTDYKIYHRDSSREFMKINQAFNSMTRQIVHLKIRNYEEKLEKQAAEMRILQLQINPHFLVNCLNIIYSLAQVRDYATIQKLTQHMSHFFRRSLNREYRPVTIAQELQMVREYISIAQIRFPDCLKVVYELDESAEDIQIPPLIVQTFVENAIKHAVVMGRVTTLTIATKTRDGQIGIRIEDDGGGIAPDILEKIRQKADLADERGAHIGIFNAMERVEQLPGGQITITCDSGKESTGTIVRIQFDLGQDRAKEGCRDGGQISGIGGG